jgi:hypothetical protein
LPQRSISSGCEAVIGQQTIVVQPRGLVAEALRVIGRGHPVTAGCDLDEPAGNESYHAGQYVILRHNFRPVAV